MEEEEQKRQIEEVAHDLVDSIGIGLKAAGVFFAELGAASTQAGRAVHRLRGLLACREEAEGE